MRTGLFNGHKFKYDRMFEDYENVFFDENDKIFVCTTKGKIRPLFSNGGNRGKRKGQGMTPLKPYRMFFSKIDEDRMSLGLKQLGAELIGVKDDVLYIEYKGALFKIGFTENLEALRSRLKNMLNTGFKRKQDDSADSKKQVVLVKLGRPTIEDVKRFDNFKQAGEELGITEEQAKDACEKRKQVKDYTIMSAGFRKGDVFYDNGIC